MAVDVTFSVNVDTQKGQRVCVVGDHDRLGGWDPVQGVDLERNFTGQNWKQWTCVIPLEANKTYNYRFFVTKQQQTTQGKSPGKETLNHKDKNGDIAHTPLTVYKWETNIRPRQFSTNDCGPTLELPHASFGKYDGTVNIGKGWLINQSEVQIRLHSNPIYMWKAKHREQTYSIKCTAMDYSTQGGPPFDNEDDDSRDGPPPCSDSDVSACNLSLDDCRPAPQGPAGMLYNKDDYVVYRSQMADPEQLGFQLDFFVCETNRAPKFVGSSHLLPHKLKESQHKKKVPIIGCNHKPIGEIMVEFLVARPTPGLVMDMSISYQTHWKWRAPGEKPLDIGHRGMGSSYSQLSSSKENTVASFNAAGQHGADFVEFDVSLSKDKQPVIFHDFSVKVSYSNKKNHKVQSELFEIPVKSLTLAQLQSMQLFAGHSGVGINDDETEGENLEPFPTLEKVLTEVDEKTGFDIEVKYPQQDENDEWEMENFFDVNDHLDQILKVVFAHAGSRKIVFSTFDPDTCVLLQLKQNKYPVFFLHQGLTQIYTPFKDYRAYSFKNGIQFAYSEQILGVALHSEVLLRDLNLIDRVLEKKLVLFVWGEDNNDPKMIRRLRDLKVDGIIYDRIDCHKPEHQQPEFHLISATDAASFMSVVKNESSASVHFRDARGNSCSPEYNGSDSGGTGDEMTTDEKGKLGETSDGSGDNNLCWGDNETLTVPSLFCLEFSYLLIQWSNSFPEEYSSSLNMGSSDTIRVGTERVKFHFFFYLS